VYHPDNLTLSDLKKIYKDADKYLDKSAFINIIEQVDKEMKTSYYYPHILA
jgi:benzoyl-CoA reductase/2-hydroxyglutaryl-CoA dehydratase subunit BcrC/BadD/HgdB